MSLGKGAVLKAEDINAFKTKVKNELARRKYTNSVASYAGSDYDYTTTAGSTKVIIDHWDKLVAGLKVVLLDSSSTLYDQYQNNAITWINSLDSNLDILTQAGLTSTAHGCARAACQGLCNTANSGSTSGGCQDCTSACATSNNCSSTCGESCDSTCRTTCSGGCKTGCGYSCGMNTT